METPYVTHLTLEDYEHVYEPAEDSFLLMDALESELEFIKKLCPSICVEIGSGSGVNITAIANVLKSSCFFMATDINPYASRITKKTANINGANVDAIQMDLVTQILDKSIDILIFNPPYVPTASITTTTTTTVSKAVTFDEIKFTNLDKNLINSWAGGVKGREIIDRLLCNLDNVLSLNGVLYMLVLKENDPDEIACNLGERGFTVQIIMQRQIRGEHLFILKIFRI